jgi:uncharacterized membrane protein YkvA (DUF1232 family)
MNIKKVKATYQTFADIADALLNNKSKTLLKVKEGSEKAIHNKAALAGVWDKLQLLIGITRDYANGSYTTIPKGSIIAIAAGLLYFISPIDVIPDFILGLGFVDDAYILSIVFRQVAKDLEKYKTWKANQAKIISI